MKALYWETSCVLALYVPERISSQVAELASVEKRPIYCSAILEFEMTFAIHAKEAWSEIPRGSSERLLSRFQTDHQRGRYLLVPLGIDTRPAATRSLPESSKQEPPVFLRTLGRIHITTALKLGSPELDTADKKMADAANLLGIKTKLLKEITSE